MNKYDKFTDDELRILKNTIWQTMFTSGYDYDYVAGKKYDEAQQELKDNLLSEIASEIKRREQSK